MNSDRLRVVADKIEAGIAQPPADGIGFNMGTYNSSEEPDAIAEWWHSGEGDRYGHGCQTVACIAGFTVLAFPDEHKELADHRSSHVRYSRRAMLILGLTEEEADLLFLKFGYSNNLVETTPQEAVATLRRAANTGRIEW